MLDALLTGIYFVALAALALRFRERATNLLVRLPGWPSDPDSRYWFFVVIAGGLGTLSAVIGVWRFFSN